MYKLMKTPRNTDGLSIGYDRHRDRRKREITNNKNITGKYHVTIMLEVFLVLPNTKKRYTRSRLQTEMNTKQ